jgi:hypothetical protein
MELIIAIVVVVLGVALYFNRKKPESTDPVETWTPPKEMHLTDAPAPALAPVVEADVVAPAKKPAAKKPAAKKTTVKAAAVKKPAPAKKAPAKTPAKKPKK